MSEEENLTEEQKRERELAKEKAQAWLIGQRFAKRNLNESALRHTQKEKEKEELEEMIEDAIEEVVESGGESNQESSQEKEG